MRRFALDYLKKWSQGDKIKPLIIRGARQVGKSYLVRKFAEEYFEDFIEINFELSKSLLSYFEEEDPNLIIQNLSVHFSKKIEEGKTLLFFDEIQAAPQVIAQLRYLHEAYPKLHIVAAGSLLEFTLAEMAYSMPVGRIEYLYLGPMQFEEFLLALDEEVLYDYLNQYQLNQKIPEALHEKFLALLREFWVIGGMPESIQTYVDERDFDGVDRVKASILGTYQEDFNKYAAKIDSDLMQKLFNKIPSLVGNKFKYSQVDREIRNYKIKQSLELLVQARVVFRVFHSSANTLPLAAEMNDQYFKVIFLDVGLMNQIYGFKVTDLKKLDYNDSYLGAMSEQFIGQHLLYSKEFYEKPELYYWMREQRNSSAEIDYLYPQGVGIIPIEVKSGKTGSLKSLQIFMKEKNKNLALRFDAQSPSVIEKPFKLISLPHYLVGQTRRLLRD